MEMWFVLASIEFRRSHMHRRRTSKNANLECLGAWTETKYHRATMGNLKPCWRKRIKMFIALNDAVVRLPVAVNYEEISEFEDIILLFINLLSSFRCMLD
jgi:hypothetical protein